MSNHTPGPWKKAKYKVSAASGALIAHTRPTGEGSSDDEANARLIAAAPEMLDVLRRVDVSIVGCEANATSRKHWQEDMEAVKEMVRQTLRAADGDA